MARDKPPLWPNHEADLAKPKAGPQGHKAGIAMVGAWLAIMLLAWLAVGPCAGCATLADVGKLLDARVDANIKAVVGVNTETTATANFSGTDSIGGTLAVIGLIVVAIVCPSPLQWMMRRRNGNRDPPP